MCSDRLLRAGWALALLGSVACVPNNRPEITRTEVLDFQLFRDGGWQSHMDNDFPESRTVACDGEDTARLTVGIDLIYVGEEMELDTFAIESGLWEKNDWSAYDPDDNIPLYDDSQESVTLNLDNKEVSITWTTEVTCRLGDGEHCELVGADGFAVATEDDLTGDLPHPVYVLEAWSNLVDYQDHRESDSYAMMCCPNENLACNWF